MIFYSNNHYFFHRLPNEYDAIPPGYKTYSWDDTWIASRHPKEFLSRVSGLLCSNFRVTGPPWFQDNGNDSGPIRDGIIFDVPPSDIEKIMRSSVPDPFYTIDLTKAFFEDLSEVIADSTLKFSIKPKYKLINYESAYTDILKNLEAQTGTRILDPYVSPYRHLETHRFCICMPFTTVAWYALARGMPVAYYLPQKILDSINLETITKIGDGVPVLFGRAALKSWILSTQTMPNLSNCVD